jgi:hypothetical protein
MAIISAYLILHFKVNPRVILTLNTSIASPIAKKFY